MTGPPREGRLAESSSSIDHGSSTKQSTAKNDGIADKEHTCAVPSTVQEQNHGRGTAQPEPQDICPGSATSIPALSQIATETPGRSSFSRIRSGADSNMESHPLSFITGTSKPQAADSSSSLSPNLRVESATRKDESAPHIILSPVDEGSNAESHRRPVTDNAQNGGRLTMHTSENSRSGEARRLETTESSDPGEGSSNTVQAGFDTRSPSSTLGAADRTRESSISQDPQNLQNSNNQTEFLCFQTNPGALYPVTECWKTPDQIKELNLSALKGHLVIFLPRITDLLNPEDMCFNLPKDFRDRLRSKFKIDKFFLTKTGYQSNGFFLDHHQSKQAYGCRFLVKELEPLHRAEGLRATQKLVREMLGDSEPQEQSQEPKAVQQKIVSVSDEPIQSLLQKFFAKWSTQLKTEGFPDFAKTESPVELLDAWEKWLKEDKERFAGFIDPERKEKIRKQIDEILLRGYHAISCIGEVRDEGQAKGGNATTQQENDSSALLVRNAANQQSDQPSIQNAANLPAGQGSGRNEDRRLQPTGPTSSSVGHPSTSIPPEQSGKKDKSPSQGEGLSVYHWLFLSFWTVFISGREEGQSGDSNSSNVGKKRPRRDLEVLLCFDDANGSRMKELIRTALDEQYRVGAENRRKRLLPQVLEEIVHTYDDALWGFRAPVRDIEKRRDKKKGNTSGGQQKSEQPDGDTAIHKLLSRPLGRFRSTNPEEDVEKYQGTRKDGPSNKQQQSKRLDTYTNMHELSRHLIHSQETLDAAETCFKAILSSKEWDTNDNEWDTNDNETLHFCRDFIINLELRAGAFVKRLDNEIALELHINNLAQLEKVEDLLQENQRDGKEVTKFVGYASMSFLPGTFVSGFFSMTFFSFEGSGWPHARRVWIWIAVTVPMTAIAIAMLYLSRTRKLENSPLRRLKHKMVHLLDEKPPPKAES